jgi:GGDEF domain-containing protein
LAKRLLALIRGWEPALPEGRSLRVTVSASIATYPGVELADGDAGERLLKAAEQALQLAKDAGGDQVIAYQA